MVKKNRRFLLLIAALALVIAVLVVLLLFRGRSPGGSRDFMSEVTMSEVEQELKTEAFPAVDWTNVFENHKGSVITKKTAVQIVEQLGAADYIEVPGRGKRHVLTREEWCGLYDQLLDYLDMTDVVQKTDILILDTVEAKEQGILVTNEGDFTTVLNLAGFEKWKSYEVYHVENRCIGMAGYADQEVSVKNAYLKGCTSGSISFLYDGAAYEKSMEPAPQLSAGVYDFLFLGGEIVTIREKKDKIYGNLLSYDAEIIEIQGYGKVDHENRIPVYQIFDGVVEKSISDVVLGNMEATYVTGEGQVCAILLEKPASIANIRVLLLAEGDKFREDVWIKATEEADVSYGDQKSVLTPGELLQTSGFFGEEAAETLTVSTKTPEGRLYLCDAAGEAMTNAYRGTFEVRRYAQGSAVVNVLPFEEYLYGVVPSEMPASYAPEALKVQAVCARSYAYRQLMAADLAAYGAHIDDSTSYQVYNKVAPFESTTAAVNATAGQVITADGEVVEAYYFSTSMGYTGTADVWNITDTDRYQYLQKKCLNESEFAGDLSKEEDFAAYIATSPNGYDSGIKFYRWQAAGNITDQTAKVQEILENRYQVVPQSVLIYRDNESEALSSPAALGALLSVSAEERNPSGALICLHLQYENGYAKVKTEYNIRKVLGAFTETVTYADGSVNEDVTMLPSAYCTVEAGENGSLRFVGGGYGHGIGMSQNGANGMAKSGKSYDEILRFFYEGIEIETIKNESD